jgi:glutamate 5-kinase
LLGSEGLRRRRLLLTLEDLEDRRRYLNAAATLDRLLEAGVMPVINENDSVATEEIRFGDNDRLAARVAQAANADLRCCCCPMSTASMTATRARPGAALVPVVDAVTPEVHGDGERAPRPRAWARAGWSSKLQAARSPTRAGIALAILNGTHDAPIAHALARGRGRCSCPSAPRAQGLARRAAAAAGELRVDKGCAEALKGGASLLAAGIVGVSGQFRRGDLVSVLSLKGERLAQGLAEYDAAEMQLIAGKRAEEQAERWAMRRVPA